MIAAAYTIYAAAPLVICAWPLTALAATCRRDRRYTGAHRIGGAA